MAAAYRYAAVRRKRSPVMSRIPWEKILSFTPLDFAKLLITIAAFWLTVWVLRRFGINLIPD